MAINRLGIELLLQARSSEGNVLLSPYSIQTALAMAYAGSDGVTREEMMRALHYPEDELALHLSFVRIRALLDLLMLNSADLAQRTRGTADASDPVVITVANRLFAQSGYPFREPFQSLLQSHYDAPMELLDLGGDPGGATRQINNWVEEETLQRIRNLIPEGALDQLTRLVLANAIYLKAPWWEPFQRSATRNEPFHVTRDTRADVEMMSQTLECNYAEGDGFQALDLPFRGGELRFLVLLPRQVEGLAALQQKLTAEMLTGRLNWESRDVSVHLPRFKLEPPRMKLGAALQALGVKSAFDVPKGSANFECMAPRQPLDYLYVSEMFHQTFLALDEQGVEASAASAFLMGWFGGPGPEKPLEVRVDHPFVFAVLHRASGACLFLGHLQDPTRSA